MLWIALIQQNRFLKHLNMCLLFGVCVFYSTVLDEDEKTVKQNY